MDSYSIKDNIEIFLEACKLAKSCFDYAIDQQHLLEDATQDVLHTCELQPNSIDGSELIATIHKIREERRICKKEVEVSTIFNEWCKKNTAVINDLEVRLGQIRKIINKQNEAQYRYKTNYVKEKDSWITEYKEPEWEQMCLW